MNLTSHSDFKLNYRQTTNERRNIVTRSRAHCCHGNATICSLFIVDISVPVSNIKVLIVAMEIKQRVPLPLLYSYKVMRKAVNNTVWRVTVFLAYYSTCKAHALYYVVVCALSGSATLFHNIS